VHWSSQNEVPCTDQVLQRLLLDSLTDYAIFAVSPSGLVMSWNSGAKRLFGYRPDEILGAPFGLICTAEDVLAEASATSLTNTAPGQRPDCTRQFTRKDGTHFCAASSPYPIHGTSNELVGFAEILHDVDPRLTFAEKSDDDQRSKCILEGVSECAISAVSLDGAISSWNAGAEQIFGYSSTEVMGQHVSQLFSADDLASGEPETEMQEATVMGSARFERWMLRKNGSRFRASGRISQLKCDASGKSRGFVRVVHDVTDNYALVEELQRRAQYDELTQLPNRRTFYDHVRRAISSMNRRPSQTFAVLFIDVDHFKGINDNYGHLVADQFLATAARRLESCIRGEDIVARFGGDEFSVLLNGLSSVADADDTARRICETMGKSVRIDKYDVKTTVSVGIAIGNRDYKRPEDILSDADHAMYAAKAQGRAQAVRFSRKDSL
jgi:diguanylate cyclase (GGDEF)-like protein/PAS domain S-box-containing protein